MKKKQRFNAPRESCSTCLAAVNFPSLCTMMCINDIQKFEICTVSTFDLQGTPVKFITSLKNPEQKNNVQVNFISANNEVIPVPFNELGLSFFPISPLPPTVPLGNQCSIFTIQFTQIGAYELTVQVLNVLGETNSVIPLAESTTIINVVNGC